MLQGLIITFFACFMGSLLGVFLAANIQNTVPYIESLLQLELLNTEIYPINYLPIEIKINDILLICSLASAMSLLATIIPAVKAGKIPPAKALRYL